jgi:SAM-dependent methyltransferase
VLGGSQIAEAYDELAGDYDRQLEEDGWMRRILWRHFDRLFCAGDCVLDVGCGTGLDSIHLASRRIRVTAVDASPEMVARLRTKAAAGIADAPAIYVGEINEVLAGLPGPFDGIVSSFAALNTVALDAFAEAAARLLRPGGRAVCHMLSPGYHRGRLSRWRRWRSWRADGVARAREREREEVAIPLAGRAVAHLNLPPLETYRRFFATRFEQRECYALGLTMPRRGSRRIPRSIVDALGRADVLLGSVPWLLPFGRFFVLDLERRP